MSTTLKKRIAKLEQQQEPEASQPQTFLEEVKAALDRLTQQRQADTKSAAEAQHKSDYMILVKALENPEFVEALTQAAEMLGLNTELERGEFGDEEREPPAPPHVAHERRHVQETHGTEDAPHFRPVFRPRKPSGRRE